MACSVSSWGSRREQQKPFPAKWFALAEASSTLFQHGAPLRLQRCLATALQAALQLAA